MDPQRSLWNRTTTDFKYENVFLFNLEFLSFSLDFRLYLHCYVGDIVQSLVFRQKIPVIN